MKNINIRNLFKNELTKIIGIVIGFAIVPIISQIFEPWDSILDIRKIDNDSIAYMTL